MKQRPLIHPDLHADIIDRAPSRVRRKLDRAPQVAQAWPWHQEGDTWRIEVNDQTVRLTAPSGVISTLDQVGCNCLLSPRCYHLLACLAILETAGNVEAQESSLDLQADESSDPNTAVSSQPSPTFEVSLEQRQAAETAWQAAAKLLAVGARSAGSLMQSQILRAIHQCRSVALHRLANSGVRVVSSIRQLQGVGDLFDSETLAGDLGDFVSLAWRIRSAHQAGRSLQGVARRRFESAGSLMLSGLFSEPVLTRSGYSGVVTYMCDEQGRLLTVSDVRPGDSDRIGAAWQTGVDVGGLSLSHRALSCRGILMQRATCSIDRRLGSSRDCQAAPRGVNNWQQTSVMQRFAEPLPAQVKRIFEAAEATDPALRPAGDDLLFLRGELSGSDGRHVLLQVDDNQHLVRLAVALESDDLPFRENLSLLSTVHRLPVLVIARLVPRQPAVAAALAIAADSNNDNPNDQDVGAGSSAIGWALPRDWANRVSLGLDRLERSHFSAEGASELGGIPAVRGSGKSDGLHVMRRRLVALAVGGRHSLPAAGLKAISREADQYTRRLQVTAGQLLKNLVSTAGVYQREFSGVRFPRDPQPLAGGWLACHLYERAAARAFQQNDWLSSAEIPTSGGLPT